MQSYVHILVSYMSDKGRAALGLEHTLICYLFRPQDSESNYYVLPR